MLISSYYDWLAYDNVLDLSVDDLFIHLNPCMQYVHFLQRKYSLGSFNLLGHTAPAQAASLLILGPFLDYWLTNKRVDAYNYNLGSLVSTPLLVIYVVLNHLYDYQFIMIMIMDKVFNHYMNLNPEIAVKKLSRKFNYMVPVSWECKHSYVGSSRHICKITKWLPSPHGTNAIYFLYTHLQIVKMCFMSTTHYHYLFYWKCVCLSNIHWILVALSVIQYLWELNIWSFLHLKLCIISRPILFSHI